MQSEIQQLQKMWTTPVSNISLLPATGELNVRYLVGSAEPYQEYLWDGTDYVELGIDSVSRIEHEVKLSQAIAKGKAVYVSDANGTNMIVSKADHASEITSSKTLGLLKNGGVTNDIVTVVTEGLLAGLDTSTATLGDPVWLGTKGDILFGVANKPVAPDHMVYLGVVTRVSSTVGEIFVHVQNGFELEELHNVLIENPREGDTIHYDAVNSLWKNKTDWYEIAINGQYNGTQTTIATGIVREREYRGTTYYRLTTTATNANDYPVEDSFYTTFTGGVLSGLVVTRG